MATIPDLTMGQAAPALSSDEQDRSAVKSLRKALDILKAVADAERPPTVAEVAVRTGLARPTAYRLVQTLVSAGHLEQWTDGRLGIGFSVLPLAASLLDRNRMRLEALPRLQALAFETQLRSNLGILHQGQLLYLAGVEKPKLPTIYSRFGRLVSAHSCSLGKAILAFLPDAEANAILSARALAAETPHTITTLPALSEDLAETRARGYAVDRQERVLGTFCLAAPIFDPRRRPTGAIGVTGSALEQVLACADTVRHEAEVLSHLL